MRTIGVTILGLFLGILVGFLLTEVIARAVVGGDGQGAISTPLAMVIGFATPVGAVAGAVGAVLVDRRVREPRARDNAVG